MSTITVWPDYQYAPVDHRRFDVQGDEILFGGERMARLTVPARGSSASEFIEGLRDAVTLEDAAAMVSEESGKQRAWGGYEGGQWGLERVEEVIDVLRGFCACRSKRSRVVRDLLAEIEGLEGRKEVWNAENEADKPEE